MESVIPLLLRWLVFPPLWCTLISVMCMLAVCHDSSGLSGFGLDHNVPDLWERGLINLLSLSLVFRQGEGGPASRGTAPNSGTAQYGPCPSLFNRPHVFIPHNKNLVYWMQNSWEEISDVTIPWHIVCELIHKTTLDSTLEVFQFKIWNSCHQQNVIYTLQTVY